MVCPVAMITKMPRLRRSGRVQVKRPRVFSLPAAILRHLLFRIDGAYYNQARGVEASRLMQNYLLALRHDRASGYNWRALVEADIGRYKRVIGDALRSR